MRSILYKNCFISDELVLALSKGSFDNNIKSRDISKDNLGIYVVKIKTFALSKDILVYNYIYYPNLFIDYLLMYVLTRYGMYNSMVFKEWGDYLIILDDSLFSKYDKNSVLDYNKYNERYIKTLKYHANLYMDGYNDLYDILHIIKTMNYVTDYKTMLYIINLMCKNQTSDLVKFVLKNDELKKNLFDNKFNDELIDDYRLLNNCVFFVKDLELFKKTIEDSFVINEGSQKWRGQVNTMNSFLNLWDYDFRENLWDNYTYHLNKGNIEFPISKNKFSFKNIHMKLGKVRW